ncbi:hypothetical protein [Pengzhenrongella phosphoraccumulans]|uniref:hypothetical protein n=1 Tax=Pengzhenrongella phosphoraccumulans TaxID=3114394 RepID=UPI00388ECFA1
MVKATEIAARFIAAFVAVSALAGLTAGQAAAAIPAAVAPTGFTVTRQVADVNLLDVNWKAVAGATRYTVTVFDGVNQFAYDVAATATTFTFTGNGNCTRYRVNVASIDAAGTRAATPDTIVNPLSPGGITGLQIDRSDDGGTVTAAWTPPASAAKATSYAVLFRSLADGTVLVQRNSPDAVEVVSGLEPLRSYVMEIVPTNQYGSCAPSKVLVRGPQPASPTSLKVVRTENDANLATVTWVAPAWTGYGPITTVQLGVRNPTQATPTWIDLPADATSAQVSLPNSSKWSVWVRAVNGNVIGEISQEYMLEKPGAPGTPAVDPKVHIDEVGGVITVTFDSPVGSSIVYPGMNVSIAGTTTDNGYKESQNAYNRAQTFIFDKVPCGAFTVVVTGFGPTGSQEFGRKMINRCGVGLVPANQWKLIFGRSTIAGNAVDNTFGNEARVISITPRTSPDMVYSTEATLVSGGGYGIWTRASVSTGASVSGYTFQYDPGYAAVQPGFGKALLLRVWSNGAECGNPIAKVQWPVGLEVNATHQVTVVTRGDTLFATIDGIKMFDVASLKGALADSKCNMPEPTGSQVGFRTWSATGKATFRNTTIN